VARIYDALLGGKDNYATDREAALALTAAIPCAAQAARDNRAFLARAVRYLAGQAGITQFLDIGTGLPTHGHVHEIAQAANPGARVAYVDNDRCKSGCAHARVSPSLRSRGAVRLSRPFVPSSPSRPLRADTREGGTKGRSRLRLRRVIVRPSVRPSVRVCVPYTRRHVHVHVHVHKPATDVNANVNGACGPLRAGARRVHVHVHFHEPGQAQPPPVTLCARGVATECAAASSQKAIVSLSRPTSVCARVCT
jgi:hypothetical protein